MRGDRHMATSRAHNHVARLVNTYSQHPIRRTLTKKQRLSGSHAIGNRGQIPPEGHEDIPSTCEEEHNDGHDQDQGSD